MAPTMRKLFLHSSALSGPEYATYTAAMRDILDDKLVPGAGVTNSDDDEIERMKLGVREVRAWVRGRYPNVGNADQILRMFCPSLGPTDMLSGGQLFAALRLVMHSRKKLEPSEDLVFIQADTSPSPTPLDSKSNSNHLSPKQPSPQRNTSNPFHKDQYVSPQEHASVTSSTTTSSTARITDRNTETPQFRGISSNPFIMKSRQSDEREDIQQSPPKPLQKLPPLPPRKPSNLLSSGDEKLRKTLSDGSNPIVILAKTKPSPPLAPSHTKPVSTTPLMRQSLEASKAGHNLKRVQDQLGKERILEIIQSSSKHPSPERPSESSAFLRPSLNRRVPSPPRSIATSTNSLEQIANASLGSGERGERKNKQISRPSSPSSSSSFPPPDSDTSPLPAPPPTHPDRRPSHRRHVSLSHRAIVAAGEPLTLDDVPVSPTSPSARPSRSKSMHSPSSPPLPPPRRRRPESVQITGRTREQTSTSNVSTPLKNTFSTPASNDTGSSPLKLNSDGTPLSRHLSAQQAPVGMEAFSTSISKTFTSLQQKAQPALDRARYKAEAGLSKRGFISNSQLFGTSRGGAEERLMSRRYGESASDEDNLGVDDTLDNDSDESDKMWQKERERLKTGNGQGNLKGNGVGVGVGSGRDPFVRDELKLPAGEGWKQL